MSNRGFNGWRQIFVVAGVTAVMSTSLAWAPQVSALGLGEIETRSALNERFAAEIELLDTRDLDASEVIASLASTDDFRRVGVERFFFLTSLQFDVVRNSRGNLVITASSNQPITEPYLNFLVEVLWPAGRLLKEYTVLLDPPTFTHSAAAPVAAPTTESTDIASAGRVQRNNPAGVQVPSIQTGSQAQVGTSAPKNRANDGTYGSTTRNDTLWAIANETLPSNNVTPQQNMLAIQRLNPNAFIDNNVNLLKAGVVLRLPSEGDAQSIGQSEAVAQVREQTQAWRAGSPSRALANAPADGAGDASSAETQGAAIDATSRGPGETGDAQQKTDGRLSIVAADASGVLDGTDNTGAGESQTQVAGDPAAQEQIESLARQVDELTYQLDLQKRGVEQQVAAKDKQISLKDQQISQLQEQLRAASESGSAQSQDQSTSPAATAEATPFWQKPMVLGGALGVLALLLAGALFKRRQAKAAAEDLELDDFETSEPSFELGQAESGEAITPLADADLVGDLNDADLALAQAESMQEDADLEQELSGALDDNELTDDDLFGPSDDAASDSDSEQSPQTSDVIGEADIYIAYGRYPQAIALLQGAVDSNPSDHAVRVRLLEVCAETKDAAGYAEQSRALRQYCEDQDRLAAADALHASLEDDFRAEVESLADASEDDNAGLGAAVMGSGAAIAAGAASLLGGDDASADESAEQNLDEFAFDTSVTDGGDASVGDLTGEADTLLADEFELDLDTDLTAEASTEDAGLDFDMPSVDTDEFATNVDMESASVDGMSEGLSEGLEDAGNEIASEVEDFELDLGLDTDTDADSLASLDADDVNLDDFDPPTLEFETDTEISSAADTGADVAAEVAAEEVADFDMDLDAGLDDTEIELGSEVISPDALSNTLGGDLGIDFPEETTELARVVAETDDEELLDEIERSLDELEADGLLTPDLDEDAQFSFDDDADTSATKLDLARAYIDMGDDDGAREILGEVISEGDSSQQGEANELLNKL